MLFWWRKNTLLSRFLCVYVAVFAFAGVVSMLLALTFLAITSVVMRIVVTTISIALITTFLAWRSTLHSRMTLPSSIPHVYLTNYRQVYPYIIHPTLDEFPTGVVPLSPCSLVVPDVYSAVMERCFDPPPAYCNSSPTAAPASVPPPLYSSNDTHILSTSSPPPQYQTLDTSLFRTCNPFMDSPPGRLIRIIDCSKAEPSTMQLLPTVTAF
ncbi:hypothetical protein AB6A40_004030 [Gnathostoma spinigerum]|uniref:Uncharacterized protein n=1 Tax=Gnathostoma spinigerum TaxID=75299 RepID=A0ABD6EIU9_9BILA